MARLNDLTGQVFSGLTVLRRVENRGKETRWLCRCDCGNEVAVAASHLRSGHTASCGHLRHNPNALVHGMSATKLHRVLRSMRGRCVNPNDPGYRHYGGRGISVCDEWMTDATSFLEWAIANGYREGLTLDRIDNDGNYCPDNCRFVDRVVQMNNRRGNRRHEYRGASYTLAQLSQISGLCAETIANRLDVQELSIEDAVETPPMHAARPRKVRVHV